MKGIYNIEIYNSRIRYKLTLYRNISVIKGNSGTGKSRLIKLLSDWLKNGRNSGVHCIANAKLGILDVNTDWKSALKEKGYIYFADENCKYVGTSEFENEYRNSENYLVIISRSFNALTYSVNCIYEMVSNKVNGKYVNSLSCRYVDIVENLKPDLVITEDKGSGRYIYSKIFSDAEVVSAGSKDNVHNIMDKIDLNSYNCVYIIVDGAAFGSCLSRIVSRMKDNCHIFTPESFEYLVLNCKNYRVGIDSKLINTYDYCDYPKYVSWEGYYTDLLSEVLNSNFGVGYSKFGVSRYLDNRNVIEGIRSQIRDIGEYN